jgi:FixJ family two-component response regulator
MVYAVNDDKFFPEFISEFLSRSGLRVASCLSAAELLADLRPDTKGCIFADV